MGALRDHYGREGRSAASPHGGPVTPICRAVTNSSTVFQPRDGMPPGVGAVWWLALWQPCSSSYVPIYAGIESVPPLLAFPGGEERSARAYRTFGEFARWVDTDYGSRFPRARMCRQVGEAASFAFQRTLEEHLRAAWDDGAREIVTRYCHGAVARAAERAHALSGSPD